jgi:dihydropteroate synthase
MGILNVTPDSFSDGGRFQLRHSAISHAAQMAKDGADIIDVGGESTRPGAVEIPVQEEIDRVGPVIEALVTRIDVPVSIDTSKPEVMATAVAAGASMINDVYGLRREGAMQAAAQLDAAICIMHMLGTPMEMQLAPQYDRLPDDVIDFLRERVEACSSAGIDPARLIVDPGFGFGKNDAHNFQSLAKLDQFADLGVPLLVGLSRKRTLGNLTGRSADDRLASGVSAAVIAVTKGAHIVRTHDVSETVDALKVVLAVRQAGKEL